MNVFVLGGTGSIGRAVVRTLITRGHSVLALCRSELACELMSADGALPVRGDMREPQMWIDALDAVDAVVHAASTWGADEANVDRTVVDAMVVQLQRSDTQKRFIYTGGCWLYGATGDRVVNESSPLVPISVFAWVIPVMRRVLDAPRLHGMAIHPAMVYERDAGVLSLFVDDARRLGAVRVVDSESVRWPLVHSHDLAVLYALMLERGRAGCVYNAVAEPGVPVGTLARAVAVRSGARKTPRVISIQAAIDEFGDWAQGLALDQQMSSEKARQQLGWCPMYTDVIADLRREGVIEPAPPKSPHQSSK